MSSTHFLHQRLKASCRAFWASLPTISHTKGSMRALHWTRVPHSSTSSGHFSQMRPSTAPNGSQAFWVPENTLPHPMEQASPSTVIPRKNKIVDVSLVALESASVRNSSWNTGPVSRKVLTHKEAMKRSFPDGWAPPRKISREAMDGLRTLHRHDPDTFTTPVLAEKFKISPEAVRRILKSRWQPDEKRKAQMAEKEVRLREEWRAQKRQEEVARKAAKRQKPVEMFMDQESDVEFLGNLRRS